jgi:CRP/FNR family transcriptional regulator
MEVSSNNLSSDLNIPGQKKKFNRGEIIYHEDSPSYGLYLVNSGILKVYTSDDSGKEIILRLAGPGDIVGYHFLFKNMIHIDSSKVIENSVCNFIDKKTLQEIQKNSPETFDYIIQKIGQELMIYQDKSVELIKKNVRERLASFFCYMAKNHSEIKNQKIRIKVQLSREEIASMIGKANETAIRFISEFKDLGLVEEVDRFFLILEKEKIDKLAGHL